MLDMLAAFVRVHTSVFVHRRGGLRGAQQQGYEHDHGQAFSCDLSSRDRASTTRTTQVASAKLGCRFAGCVGAGLGEAALLTFVQNVVHVCDAIP